MNYLIWSNEHTAWWRADRSGYTVRMENAGRYTREQAMQICKGANYGFMEDTENPSEIPVLENDALEALIARPYQRIVGQKKVRRHT